MLIWIVLNSCDKCSNVLSIYLVSGPGSSAHSSVLFAPDPTSHNCRLNIKCVVIGAAVLHSAWTDKLLVTVNLLHHVWKGHSVTELPGVCGTQVFHLLDIFKEFWLKDLVISNIDTHMLHSTLCCIFLVTCEILLKCYI